MAIKSALASFVSLMHGDRASTIDAATQAFADDFGHFARANNREPLNVAIAALKKAPKDKAISQAINEAYKTSNLTVGYIGANSGKFSAQPDSVQATFNDAIKAASEAFKLSLESSEAFAEKVAKTQEEKTKAKEEKAAKASEALENAITAKVQAGELVRSVDVRPFPQEELDRLKSLVERLQAENEAMAKEIKVMANDIKFYQRDEARLIDLQARYNDLWNGVQETGNEQVLRDWYDAKHAAPVEQVEQVVKAKAKAEETTVTT